MNRFIALLTSLFILGVSCPLMAEDISPIPTSGHPYSTIYKITGIHEAKSPMDHVRVYEMAVNSDKMSILLEVIASHRGPHKISRVIIWELDINLWMIKSVEIKGTEVRIHGREEATLRQTTCTAIFHFDKEGIIADTLDVRGCTSD